MNISILVDFGDGVKASLSVHDARYLFEQLRTMFEYTQSTIPTPTVSTWTLGTLGTHTTSTNSTSDHTCNPNTPGNCWCEWPKVKGDA